MLHQHVLNAYAGVVHGEPEPDPEFEYGLDFNNIQDCSIQQVVIQPDCSIQTISYEEDEDAPTWPNLIHYVIKASNGEK